MTTKYIAELKRNIPSIQKIIVKKETEKTVTRVGEPYSDAEQVFGDYGSSLPKRLSKTTSGFQIFDDIDDAENWMYEKICDRIGSLNKVIAGLYEYAHKLVK